MTLAVDHPSFGQVTFVFDGNDPDTGLAATPGFVLFGIEYPAFDFRFERQGDVFTSSGLNAITRQQVGGEWVTIAELAPPAFRSFVLSKAKELAGDTL